MTAQIAREETRCRHMGYSFRLTTRVILYAPSHRQDSTYNGLCYTSRGALAGTRNSSMGPPHEGSIRRPIAPWANAPTTELHLVPACYEVYIDLLICHKINLKTTGSLPWRGRLPECNTTNIGLLRNFTSLNKTCPSFLPCYRWVILQLSSYIFWFLVGFIWLFLLFLFV